MPGFTESEVRKREKTKRLLLRVILLAFALLPVAAALLAGSQRPACSAESATHRGHNPYCGNIAGVTDGTFCNGQSQTGNGVNDCCGDHCTGNPILFSTLLFVTQPKAAYYHPAWSARLPDPIDFVEVRPPIRHS